MSTPNADAWELAGFPGRLDVAAYLTADQLAAQYRVLVDVLLDAQEHSLTGVGRDELLAAVRDRIADATDSLTAEHLIRPEAFDLDARMHALQDWKVVIRWQDKAKTEADFIRTRDRYQLTSEAADLHRWLRRKIDEDAVSTSAAAFAPAIIAQRLDDTIDAIGQRDLGHAARPAPPGSAAAQTLGWARQASLPVGCLRDPAVLRTALEALTLRLDGSRAAANTIIRKRAVLHGALGYAAEAGLLPGNPLDTIAWQVPRSSATLDPVVTASPAQVSALLDAVDRTRPEMTGFLRLPVLRRASPRGSCRPAPRRLRSAQFRVGRAPAGRGHAQDRCRVDQQRHRL